MKQWLQRLRAAFAQLAPRERALVSAVGALLLVTLLWFAGLRPLLDAGDRAEQRLTSAEQRLEVIRRLRSDYDEVHQRLAAVEERIHSGNTGNLPTTLEALAKTSDVKIESMEPQSSPANEDYREAKLEVNLKQVSLPQTIRYLHEIESSDEVLSVKTLRLRTRTDKKSANLLDVTFTVSSFQPK